MDWAKKLTLPENLHWAWNKAKSIYRAGDSWFDEMEVARFEANLDAELDGIAHDFGRLEYRVSPLRPLPHPKKPSGPKEKPVRPMFLIGVRDQVAWIALVNLMGPTIDEQMPPWSYGNRLHRSVWYEDIDDRRTFRRGPYRNTANRLYRVFRQSWPLYRRHLSLTVRKMASIGDLPDDKAELQVLLAEESLAENNPARLPYLLPNWWNHPSAKVYRAHIDLKRFYPSIRLEVILENLAAYHPSLPIEFSTLLRQLLTFPLAFDGYAKTELKDLGLSPETPLYLGVPTGLFVAGFLANVGMLSIDRQVQSQIRQMQVAHFRYVDDHTFLAPTLDALLSWMDFYRELLRSKAIGVQINDRKTEPRSLQSLYKRVIRQRPDLRAGTISLSRSERARLEKDAVIDPQYPNPLMTATLAKISDVAHTPFALLDERSQDHLLQELEFLLTARLPDDEIRDDTRISFAASRLAQLAAHHVPPVPQSNDNFRPIRILHLITRAIRGYPEKLRLWLHALQFARSSGLADLTVISEELDLLARKYAPAGAYVRAFLKKFMAHQAFGCLRDVQDNEQPDERRCKAAVYLKTLLNVSFGSWQPRWFELHSDQTLEAASRAARLILSNLPGGMLVCGELRERIHEIVARDQPDGWAASFENWAQPHSSLPLWTWWLDRNTVPALATQPGPVWRMLADRLSASDPLSPLVWARYPGNLPPPAVRWALTESQEPPRADLGWLYDVCTGSRALLATMENSGFRAGTLETIRQVQRNAPGESSLHDWIRWTAYQVERQAHDPRVGEWTAVELILRIAEAVDGMPDVWGSELHQANFTVPNLWVEATDVGLTWEQWRRQIRSPERRYPSFRGPPRIHDHRFVTGLVDGTEPDRQWSLVQGLGVLLLKLVARTAELPALWNCVGYALGSWRPAGDLIRLLPLSSLTLALLEACLLPRARENLLLPELFADFLERIRNGTIDNDTAHDPPNIPTVKKFIKYATKARNTLQNYQLTVHGAMPRQLVPRHVQQLCQIDWELETAETVEE